jgi:streptomycin 3"-adenylyltransferase
MVLSTLAIPQNLKQCLTQLKETYQQILGENLRGLYLHGSIAMGCFNPESSDVDVLVVVQSPLSLKTRQALGRTHVQLAAQCPNPLEVSVILQTVLDNFTHPTPFEFHYSEDFLETFKDGSIDLTTPRKDPDLTAHMVIAKQHGIALIGRPALDVFPDVPDDDYLDSIVQDATWCIQNMMNGADAGDCQVPKYAVLNLCRVLAFIQDRQVTSKRTGAEWALANLPDTYHLVIQTALDDYTQAGSSQVVPCAGLKDFARYAKQHIEPVT